MFDGLLLTVLLYLVRSLLLWIEVIGAEARGDSNQFSILSAAKLLNAFQGDQCKR